jgi:hypothetical protein
MENGNRGFYYILKGVEETAKQTPLLFNQLF